MSSKDQLQQQEEAAAPAASALNKRRGSAAFDSINNQPCDEENILELAAMFLSTSSSAFTSSPDSHPSFFSSDDSYAADADSDTDADLDMHSGNTLSAPSTRSSGNGFSSETSTTSSVGFSFDESILAPPSTKPHTNTELVFEDEGGIPVLVAGSPAAIVGYMLGEIPGPALKKSISWTFLRSKASAKARDFNGTFFIVYRSFTTPLELMGAFEQAIDAAIRHAKPERVLYTLMRLGQWMKVAPEDFTADMALIGRLENALRVITVSLSLGNTVCQEAYALLAKSFAFRATDQQTAAPTLTGNHALPSHPLTHIPAVSIAIELTIFAASVFANVHATDLFTTTTRGKSTNNLKLAIKQYDAGKLCYVP